MNELSIEEKAKAYDEAIKIAKIYHNSGNEDMKTMCETMFPELRESKDERIRKTLLEMVYDTPNIEFEKIYNVSKEDVIAWLEKQGEQKQELLTKEKALKNSPFVEQKPWSEEDENHVKSILSTIECCKAQFPNAQAVVETYNADIDWLKTLVKRYLVCLII